MTEDLADTEHRPRLRLTSDFQFFDQDVSHTWRSFRAGDIVDDPRTIEWLTSIGAPIEPAIFRR
jgi:hypothetical protein